MKLSGLGLIASLVLLPSVSHGEPTIGGKAGISFAKWLITADMPVTVERPYKPGLTTGGYLQLRYLDILIPQFELLFMQRGTRNERDGQDLGFRRLNYVDIVLLARAEIPLKSVILYGLAGPELGVLLTATASSSDGFEEDIKSDLSGTHVGAVIGAGIAVGPFSWGTVTVEARYDRGFINVDKNDNEDGATFTNQTIAFLVGYEYRRDRDRDGIADGKDRCPRQAEDRDGFEDSDGCPDADHDSAAVTRYP